MVENLDDIEKFENEIELNEEEREKLKEFLKDKLEVLIKLKGSKCSSENRLTYINRRRQWHPTPVLLPGKSHGQTSLVGCSPWVRSELDTTK